MAGTDKTGRLNTPDGKAQFEFHKGKGFELVCGDAWVYMTQMMPADSVDLIVTSPPYNLRRQYEQHDDSLDYYSYRDLLWQAFNGMYRVLKPSGRLAINVGQMNIDGRVPMAERICAHLSERFKYRDTIVWDKGHTSNRTAWGSWKSASDPYFVHKYEFIYVFHKKEKGKGKGESDISVNEFKRWSDSIWKIRPETRKDILAVHPAPFPVELPMRLIRYLTFKGDVVFDPFMGTGTTVATAVQLNREGIGIDVDRKYYDFAVKRLTDFSMRTVDGQSVIDVIGRSV
jgi:site-specific DNA-methyltransferase (adenine-specific)